MKLENAFGEVLRKLREEKGLSQEQLGFESGFHRTYISQLERGQKSPSLKTLFGIAGALEIKPSEIISQLEKTYQ